MTAPPVDEALPFGVDSPGIELLLVDDDRDVVELSATFMERELDAVTATTFVDPFDALDAVVAGDYDCIVSDHEMPGLNGLELLERMRAADVEIPFVLFTGKGSEEIASDAISAGVDEYLQKAGPEEYPILANKVETLVEKHRTEAQVERGFLAIESAQEGIGILDEDGVYQYVNDAYASLYDRDRSELVGQHWDMLYSDAETDRFHDEILPELESQGTWRGAATGLTKSGRDVPERLVLTQMDDGGHVCIVQGRSDEVQASRKKRADVQEHLDWLSDFSRVLSHDLQNPLSVVSGNIEVAQRRGDLDRLDDARQALDRVESLVDDLSTVLRQGELVDEPGAVSLADVFESWEVFETGPEALTVVDSKRVLADEQALVRLADNLVSNTVEHAGDDASVRVGALPGGFYYEDDGPGVPEAERERVFEPGFTTKDDGTGFGMVSVKQIALAHGWSVSVAEGRDGGARFEFTGVDEP
jgi:PAS domain S-box-containing protein